MSAPFEEWVDLSSYPELATGELHNVTWAMTDIHDVLGGSLVSRFDFFIY